MIAHAGKSIDGGLPELRHTLARHGVTDPLWVEVPKSSKAPKQVKRLLKQDPELMFVWGGDGMAQRCIDTLAGTGTTVAIIPAGTANLLASNLGIPKDIEGAVMTGLHGRRRKIDVVRMNGERFAVMAGAGFDANMINGADGGLKDKLGRAAYVWTGTRAFAPRRSRPRSRSTAAPGTAARQLHPGRQRRARCSAGCDVFADAEPDDGLVELAVVPPRAWPQWARTAARTVAGSPEQVALLPHDKARKVKVKLDRKVLTRSTAEREQRSRPTSSRSSRARSPSACPHPKRKRKRQ